MSFWKRIAAPTRGQHVERSLQTFSFFECGRPAILCHILCHKHLFWGGFDGLEVLPCEWVERPPNSFLVHLAEPRTTAEAQ